MLPHSFPPEARAHFWALHLGRMLADFGVSGGSYPITPPPSLPHMAVFSKHLSERAVYSSQSLPAPKVVEMVLRGEWARREQRTGVLTGACLRPGSTATGQPRGLLLASSHSGHLLPSGAGVSCVQHLTAFSYSPQWLQGPEKGMLGLSLSLVLFPPLSETSAVTFQTERSLVMSEGQVR